MKLNRNRRYAVILTTILTLLMLAGCSSAKTEEVKEETVATVQEEVNEVEQETEVETVAEEGEQDTQESETFQSAGEWAQSVERTEPKMTIWNEITKEGIILENEQKYSLKEGDLLVICTKEKNSGIEINSDISSSEFKSRSSSNYTQFMFNKVFSEETLFEVVITVAGTDYPFSVTFIPENATSSVAETSETTEMSGGEWANSLEYEEPKLVAWNDETGTREVIDNGGQYIMQEGDRLGVYHPTGYLVSGLFPIEFAGGINEWGKVAVMEYSIPSESQIINLEVEVMDNNGEFNNFNYVITTP